MNNSRAAIYCRVSTAHQEEEQTIKNQVETLLEEARKRNLVVVERYLDEGWSGDTLERPQLDRLRNDARNKHWGVLLIYDPDRLARRYSYQELVMDELKELGIEIVFQTMPAPKNSEEKILYGVRGLFAEYERAKIKERFRLGKVRKIKEGIVISNAPYGYKYVRRTDKAPGYFEINETEANMVKMMFNWADQGMSMKKMAKTLYEMGIKPRRTKRGVFNSATICKILRGTTYYGQYAFYKRMSVVPENPRNKEIKYRRNVKSSFKYRPKEEWMYVPVPALITKELYDRVQLQLKKNSHLSSRNRKYEYLVAQKIYCICGLKRGGSSLGKGRHLSYQCNSKLIEYPLKSTCTGGITIKADKVDSLVWSKIAELMSNPELMMSQLERWYHKETNKTLNDYNELPQLNYQLQELKKQEVRLDQAYTEGIIDLGKYRSQLKPITEDIANLQNRVQQMERELEDINSRLAKKEDIYHFSQKFLSFNNVNHDFATKSALIVKVVDKIIACKNEISIYGHIPINDAGLHLQDGHTVNTIQKSDAIVPFEIVEKL